MLGQKRLYPHTNLRPEILAMGALLTEKLPGNCEDNIHKDPGLVVKEKSEIPYMKVRSPRYSTSLPHTEHLVTFFGYFCSIL